MWIDQRGSEILPGAECLRLLAMAAKEDGVGRLAVSRPDAPIVQPVNFAYRGRQVLVRLGDGFIADAANGALVSFEVDRLDQPAAVAWSVLVRGLATMLTEDEPQRLEDVGPRPFIPVPGHKILAIRADVITGRRFRIAEEVSPASSSGASPHSGPLVHRFVRRTSTTSGG